MSDDQDSTLCEEIISIMLHLTISIALFLMLHAFYIYRSHAVSVINRVPLSSFVRHAKEN